MLVEQETWFELRTYKSSDIPIISRTEKVVNLTFATRNTIRFLGLAVVTEKVITEIISRKKDFCCH